MTGRTIKIFAISLLIFLLAAAGASSADIEVPNMELITRASFDTGIPVLVTRGKVDIGISGGYKLGGSLTLGFDSSDLGYSGLDPEDFSAGGGSWDEFLANQTYLQFQAAEVTIREMFAVDLGMTYFIGETDALCSGDDFPEMFGAAPIATRYRGYLYFPDNEFDGIHKINGTGIKLSTGFGGDTNITSAYLYQDGYLGDGYFSSDLRTLFNFDKIKLEGFAGATFPASAYGYYRAGVLFYYNPGSMGEFLAQVGIPQWGPNEALDIDRVFFLFEPRVKLSPLTIILTLFWHPGYYHQAEASDSGSSDVHINFMLGDPEKGTFSGGLESSVTYNPSLSSDQFGVVTTPYISAMTSGVVWNIMLNTNLVPFDVNTMFEGVISVKAEF